MSERITRRNAAKAFRQTGPRLLACTAAILAVIGSGLAAQGGFGRGGGAAPPDPNAPTPRLASGKPDLTGSWQAGGKITGSGVQGTGWTVGDMFRRCTPFQS